MRSKVMRLIELSVVGLAFTVAGCGAKSTPVSSTTIQPSNLQGNWLAYGALPPADSFSESPPGIAIGFAVNGQNLVASVSLAEGSPLTCDRPSVADLAGTVATDGSFTVSTLPKIPSPMPGAPVPLFTLTVSGKVPTTPGGSWSGSYTIASTQSCPGAADSGTFTASTVGEVTGTYTGVAPSDPTSLPGSGVPTGVTAMLQQGLMVTPAPPATPFMDALSLSGSISVTGYSCFTKGTISQFTQMPLTASGVLGNRIIASFTMDDGSTLLMDGAIVDIEATKLQIVSLLVNNGQCAGVRSFSNNPFFLSR